MENQKRFRLELYAALSPNGKSAFDEKMKTVHLHGTVGEGASYRTDPTDGVPDEELFLEHFARSCVNVRNAAAEMEAKNWIEEPQMHAIKYKGVER